jgi:cytidine deaminase
MQPADQQLIDLARDLIVRRYREGYHHIAAALRTTAGNVFTGVHLEAYVGRIAVCAEAVALGAAATAGDTDIAVVVAVNELGAIVSPCGMCRELLLDYAPAAQVILAEQDEPMLLPLAELLPRKYARAD